MDVVAADPEARRRARAGGALEHRPPTERDLARDEAPRERAGDLELRAVEPAAHPVRTRLERDHLLHARAPASDADAGARRLRNGGSRDRDCLAARELRHEVVHRVDLAGRELAIGGLSLVPSPTLARELDREPGRYRLEDDLLQLVRSRREEAMVDERVRRRREPGERPLGTHADSRVGALRIMTTSSGWPGHSPPRRSSPGGLVLSFGVITTRTGDGPSARIGVGVGEERLGAGLGQRAPHLVEPLARRPEAAVRELEGDVVDPRDAERPGCRVDLERREVEREVRDDRALPVGVGAVQDGRHEVLRDDERPLSVDAEVRRPLRQRRRPAEREVIDERLHRERPPHARRVEALVHVGGLGGVDLADHAGELQVSDEAIHRRRVRPLVDRARELPVRLRARRASAVRLAAVHDVGAPLDAQRLAPLHELERVDVAPTVRREDVVLAVLALGVAYLAAVDEDPDACHDRKDDRDDRRGVLAQLHASRLPSGATDLHARPSVLLRRSATAMPSSAAEPGT